MGDGVGKRFQLLVGSPQIGRQSHQFGVGSLQFCMRRFHLLRTFADANLELMCLTFDAFMKPGLIDGDRKLSGRFPGNADLLFGKRRR